MPTNLYGPGDNYDPEHSHVIPGLLSKFHNAKIRGDDTVTIWGSGLPYREFLHVDDCAEAIVHATLQYSDAAPLNIGSGQDLQIKELPIHIRSNQVQRQAGLIPVGQMGLQSCWIRQK